MNLQSEIKYNHQVKKLMQYNQKYKDQNKLDNQLLNFNKRIKNN